MARPAQYSRGRRIVMQITLAGVLLATLGLAALVARSRERATTVQLAEKPTRVGRLEVRLPEGWMVMSATFETPTTLPAIATASEGRTGRKGGRIISMVQSAQPQGRGAEYALRRYLEKFDGETGDVDEITVLGQPALLVQFDSVSQVPDMPFAMMEVPGWLVAAVAPGAGDGGQDLGIVLAVEGRAAAGPVGERLVRQVADTMTVSTAPPATKPVTEATTRESAGK